MKRINIGGSDFGELVRDDLLFVDKSLFIKEIINDKTKVTIITRPRRWGKTLNMSMLHYFLAAEVYGQKTAGLFDKLLIAKEPGDYIANHQGKYPVIFISLKDVKQATLESAVSSIGLLVQDLYSQHRYLINEKKLAPDEEAIFQRTLYAKLSAEELIISLQKLSQWLMRYHRRQAYILIDEYDTPLNFSRKKEYFEDMLDFMKNFLSKSLKDNTCLQKAVITGILRISKDSMLSGLNNPKIHTMLEGRYHQHFGFTDAEVDALFVEQALTKDEQKIKDWYNGYCLNGLTLYNPWSIMNSLDDGGMIKPYWLNTGDDSFLRELLQKADDQTKEQFQSLVLDEIITVSVNPTMRFDQVNINKSMLWNLIISAGYLKILSSTVVEAGFYRCELAIPNREVYGLYHSIFLEWLIESNEPEEFKSVFDILCAGRSDQFATAIEGFLKKAASVHDFSHNPEAFYHGFMLALCASLTTRYYIFSNPESGKGRPDLVIIPKDTSKSQAVILEFKTVTGNQTLQHRAEEALAQIQARDYTAMIGQFSHIKTVLSVGMSFDGKEVLCLQDL